MPINRHKQHLIGQAIRLNMENLLLYRKLLDRLDIYRLQDEWLVTLDLFNYERKRYSQMFEVVFTEAVEFLDLELNRVELKHKILRLHIMLFKYYRLRMLQYYSTAELNNEILCTEEDQDEIKHELNYPHTRYALARRGE